MPNPTTSSLHTNGPLDNLSLAYIQDQTKFIATDVFPGIPVPHQSDVYPIYDKGDFNRDEAKVRRAGAESEGSHYRLSTNPYFAPVVAVHHDIADQDRNNADPVFVMDKDAALFVTNKMLISRERRFVTAAWGTGIWESNLTGVSGAPAANQFQQWNEADTTPDKDVDAAKDLVKVSTGQDVNVMVVNEAVHNVLKRHPVIKDQYKYTTAQSLSKAILANYFEVDEYLVGGSVFNSAAEGQTATMERIYSKSVLLIHRPITPGKLVPSAGYGFSWVGNQGQMPNGIRVRKFRLGEAFASDRVEGEFSIDFKVTGADLGAFMASAVA